jgi:hypothetical protein
VKERSEPYTSFQTEWGYELLSTGKTSKPMARSPGASSTFGSYMTLIASADFDPHRIQADAANLMVEPASPPPAYFGGRDDKEVDDSHIVLRVEEMTPNLNR